MAVIHWLIPLIFFTGFGLYFAGLPTLGLLPDSQSFGAWCCYVIFFVLLVSQVKSDGGVFIEA